MEGLYLNSDRQPIERTMIESIEIKLLAKGDGTEIILQEFDADKIFYVFPSDNKTTLEFFYILEGGCKYEPKDLFLTRGDYFYTQNLAETIFFKALSPMKILWVSSQPTFHSISDSIVELTKIVKQVEEKDEYTYQHSIRVQHYSLEIAKELKLSTEELENLYFASLFHDIGKVDIDERILNKEGKLTEEEYAIIKEHPELGANMVKATYYDKIGPIIHQHHERIDGSGYPSGLKNDEILLEAQIIGVADTFDAMTSDRPYHKGMSTKDALERIRNDIGILYKKEIVDALASSINKIGTV